MSEINIPQIVIELLILAGAFLVMYWRQRVEAEHRFTKLETLVKGLGEDHQKLEVHVTGIKQSIQELHGRISRVRDRLT